MFVKEMQAKFGKHRIKCNIKGYRLHLVCENHTWNITSAGNGVGVTFYGLTLTLS